MKKVLIISNLILVCVIMCLLVLKLSGRNNESPPDNKRSDLSTEIPPTTDITEATTEEITQATTESTTEPTTQATTEFPDSFDLELELLLQHPELPAGCESVSLTMILNYLGYDIDKTLIVDQYLVYSDNFVMGYCGEPYSYVGGGCYAPGMTITANNFLQANGNKHTAVNVTGTDFQTLLEYVAAGHPVLIWTTVKMAVCSKAHYNYDEEGNVYAWDYNEHCVVLSGYDLNAGTVTVYDPIDGIMYRDLETFKSIYEQMDEMAIIIK